jgi:hypothetical protein
VRSCDSDDDCATLSDASHVPHACVPIGTAKQCVPSLPVITPCTSDETCLGDLRCVELKLGGTSTKGCTTECRSTADCLSDAALGSAFSCVGGYCLPRTRSGCAPPPPFAPGDERCLSGKYDPNKGSCVSPPMWACDTNGQCASSKCVTGHCQ